MGGVSGLGIDKAIIIIVIVIVTVTVIVIVIVIINITVSFIVLCVFLETCRQILLNLYQTERWLISAQ